MEARGLNEDKKTPTGDEKETNTKIKSKVKKSKKYEYELLRSQLFDMGAEIAVAKEIEKKIPIALSIAEVLKNNLNGVTDQVALTQVQEAIQQIEGAVEEILDEENDVEVEEEEGKFVVVTQIQKHHHLSAKRTLEQYRKQLEKNESFVRNNYTHRIAQAEEAAKKTTIEKITEGVSGLTHVKKNLKRAVDLFSVTGALIQRKKEKQTREDCMMEAKSAMTKLRRVSEKLNRIFVRLEKLVLRHKAQFLSELKLESTNLSVHIPFVFAEYKNSNVALSVPRGQESILPELGVREERGKKIATISRTMSTTFSDLLQKSPTTSPLNSPTISPLNSPPNSPPNSPSRATTVAARIGANEEPTGRRNTSAFVEYSSSSEDDSDGYREDNLDQKSDNEFSYLAANHSVFFDNPSDEEVNNSSDEEVNIDSDDTHTRKPGAEK